MSRGIPGRVRRCTTGILHYRLVVFGRIRDDDGMVGGERNHGSGSAEMKDEASTRDCFRDPAQIVTSNNHYHTAFIFFIDGNVLYKLYLHRSDGFYLLGRAGVT